MTLDDLIEVLQALRTQCPASGTAIVGANIEPETIRYDRGMVWLTDDEDDD